MLHSSQIYAVQELFLAHERHIQIQAETVTAPRRCVNISSDLQGHKPLQAQFSGYSG